MYHSFFLAGLGFEAARQLALVETTEKVILGCRNPTKAQAAQTQLEELTGMKKFSVLQIDVSDLESCKKAAEMLPEPVDGIICVRVVYKQTTHSICTLCVCSGLTPNFILLF